MTVNKPCSDADRTFNRPCGGPARETVCYAHFFERSPDHGQFMKERDPPREVAGFRGRVKP